MRKNQRFVAAVGVFALMYASAPPAGAQANDVYQGSAAGRALRLKLTTTELSAGTSSATAASDQTANGTGTGFLVLLGTPQGNSVAGVPPGNDAASPAGANPPSTAAPRNCVLDQTVADIVTIPVACSSAKASRAGNLPAAASVGLVEDISVAGTAPLPTTLATVPTGVTTSEVTTTASNVTAKATATGGTINILPVAEGASAATVTLSPASATVVCDRATGRATPSVTAAVVTVSVAGQTAITLPPNPTQPFEIPGVAKITVAGGSTSANRAEAAGVSISVLNDTVRLDLSSVEATANCARPVVAGIQAVRDQAVGDLGPEPVLPRTGGTPWGLMATGAGVLALAVLVRRVVVRAR
jgi:hypothetical protein